MSVTTDRYACGQQLTPRDIAALLDHALLAPELTGRQVREATLELAELGVFSVCVRPVDVALAVSAISEVANTPTLVGTVLGFPHGSTTTVAKVTEARQALDDGASELDMVLQVGHLRGGDDHLVRSDIAAVVAAAAERGALVKVILETALLTDAEKERACQLAVQAGADFVKTSTGFAGGGATVPDVRLMRAAVPATVQVKASGGVRDLETLLGMVAAGARRIGTSSSPALLEQAAAQAADEAGIVVPADDQWTSAALNPEGY